MPDDSKYWEDLIAEHIARAEEDVRAAEQFQDYLSGKAQAPPKTEAPGALINEAFGKPHVQKEQPGDLLGEAAGAAGAVGTVAELGETAGAAAGPVGAAAELGGMLAQSANAIAKTAQTSSGIGQFLIGPGGASTPSDAPMNAVINALTRISGLKSRM